MTRIYQIIIVQYKNMNSYGMRDLEMHGVNRAKRIFDFKLSPCPECCMFSFG